MKLRIKILGGFLIMAVLAISLAVVGLVSAITLDGLTTEMFLLQKEQQSLSEVLNAHYNWRQNLTESVLMEKEFTGSVDPNGCALGSWLKSEYAARITDPELLQLLADIVEPHSFIHLEAREIVAATQAGDYESAMATLEEDIFPVTAKVIADLQNMQARYVSLVEAQNDESVSFTKMIQIIEVVLLMVAVVLSIFLALSISGSISKPISTIAAFMKNAGTMGDITVSPANMEIMGKLAQRKDEIADLSNGSASFIQHVTGIAQGLEAIAGGDLTHEVKLLTDKDTMGKAMKQMVDNLNNMFAEINASTNQVSVGSKQVADGAQSLAQGATEQAASIQELSSSIAEIAERTKANASTANQTAKLSKTIKENAETGSRQMDEMITAVVEINEASKNISKIIKTIDDIAFQTNILALNAAVEAARAGSAGKGFAVVAEEVRNLASKSAEAAKDTGDMIQNSMDKAELGTRIAGETAESLKEIVAGINESSQLVAEIAKSSEEQSLGISHINTGIDQVAQVIQQNSATAEESAAASEEMSGQSDMLQQLIGQFRIKESGEMYRSLPETVRPSQKRLAMLNKTEAAYTDKSEGFGKY